MERIRIKCPNCGAILEVIDNPANAGKNVTCPNCKVRNKYEDFKRVIPRIEAEDDVTQIETRIKGTIGYLLQIDTGKQYPLKEGRNLVGRRPIKNPPKADIAIETTDNGMSREHLYIDVMKGRDGYYHVYASNAKNKNATTINGATLEDGDEIGLKHGDTLMLCDTQLRYVASPIEDDTELE
jgi:pSer/pThr/pTyr-binding forkhead associated (FHA) protein